MVEPLVIGLTGSFGSGCSTVASILEQRFGFQRFALSTPIRSEWSKRQPEKDPTREQLQELGNELRKTRGLDYLAKQIWREAKKSKSSRCVVDGFRNRNEVEFFRDKCPTFF